MTAADLCVKSMTAIENKRGRLLLVVGGCSVWRNHRHFADFPRHSRTAGLEEAFRKVERSLCVFGLNRSRGKAHPSGVGVCYRASSWLCCEARQLASFTTGAQPWSHQVKPSRRCVNA